MTATRPRTAPTEHPWEAELLSMLSARWGTTTSDIAQRHSRLSVYGHNQRQRSGAAQSMLRRLEAEGKVRKMDDEYPIAWVLVDESESRGVDVTKRGEAA